jgi:hypothetical protein
MAPFSVWKRTHGHSAQPCSVSIWFLLLSNLFIFQLTYQSHFSSISGDLSSFGIPPSQSRGRNPLDNPLLIPEGPVDNLPSVRIESEQDNVKRGQYGGKGDKAHLGGFTQIDTHGISPATWKYMIEWVGVKSLLDVGCGRGISTSWFHLHGVDALCVEGSHDAVNQTLLPHPETQIVEHDFSRGPWWPQKTYDAVWCVEFLEHVGRNLHKNYMTVFRKAALIFATHSNWGGWHHVEVHNDEWWNEKMAMYGFVYSPHLTKLVRSVAAEERSNTNYTFPNGEKPNAQHVWLSMMVFINPAVASLPQHAHLLAEDGCYQGIVNDKVVNRPCGGKDNPEETELPDEYRALQLTPDMDAAWNKLLETNVKFP